MAGLRHSLSGAPGRKSGPELVTVADFHRECVRVARGAQDGPGRLAGVTVREEGIAEVEALQGLWIRTLEAVQAAAPNREQKRYARDAVMMARRQTKSTLKHLRCSLERAKGLHLGGVERFVKSSLAAVNAEIAKARVKVKSLGGDFPSE